MNATLLTDLPSYIITSPNRSNMLKLTRRRVVDLTTLVPEPVYGKVFTTETEEERENIVTLQHEKIWQRILDTKTPAVIFEDDAWATKQMPEIWVKRDRSDLLLLGAIFSTISNLYFDDFSRLVSALGTFAYVVTPPAAEILLKRPERVCDHKTRGAIQAGSLNGYLFTAPLFVTLPHKSAIGDRAEWETQHRIQYRSSFAPLKRPNIKIPQ